MHNSWNSWLLPLFRAFMRTYYTINFKVAVDFKMATLVHQSLSGISPPYLADDCRLVADACGDCVPQRAEHA